MFGIVKQLKRIADAQEALVNQQNECLALWREVQKNSDEHLSMSRQQHWAWLRECEHRSKIAQEREAKRKPTQEHP
jgi:hypothetical protein